jgi:hypothetical protein
LKGWYQVDKKEFIKLCQVCGYASKKNAEKYAEKKKVFDNADFEEVFRINQRHIYLKNNESDYNYCQVDGDYLIESLNETPAPWVNTFDARTKLLK